MISAKEARKIAKDNKDFFEKHNIENIITKLSLFGLITVILQYQKKYQIQR